MYKRRRILIGFVALFTALATCIYIKGALPVLHGTSISIDKNIMFYRPDSGCADNAHEKHLRQDNPDIVTGNNQIKQDSYNNILRNTGFQSTSFVSSPDKVNTSELAPLYRIALRWSGFLELNRYFAIHDLWPFDTELGEPLPVFQKYQNMTNITNWERFHLGIRRHRLYDPRELKGLINDIQNNEISEVVMKLGGTQLKLIITMKDECETLFKPMRYGRNYETPPNHFYFTDFERHNAEIAAFHLDKVLGYYRTPPSVGRLVHVTQELKNLSDREFSKTFFISPAGNVCFTGKCTYYCDTANAFCGNPDELEGSLAILLPSTVIAPRALYTNPWRRSYSKIRKAPWEVDEGYCNMIRNLSLFNGTKHMLDLMDMSIFDFIIGNMDRHHMEAFAQFGTYSFLLHLDHGRSFGKKYHDEMSILAPVRQCCLIRQSTFLKLMSFYVGPMRLSDALRRSLNHDMLTPVLAEGHYTAVDRRLYRILKTIDDCLNKSNISDVIINDNF